VNGRNAGGGAESVLHGLLVLCLWSQVHRVKPQVLRFLLDLVQVEDQTAAAETSNGDSTPSDDDVDCPNDETVNDGPRGPDRSEKSRSKEVIEVCQHYFNCEPISELKSRQTHKFQFKYSMLDNLLCSTVCSVLFCENS